RSKRDWSSDVCSSDLGFLDVVDPIPKVVQAKHRPQSVLTVRSFDCFKSQHRHVDRAIAKVNSFGDGRIGAADFDHVKHALVKLQIGRASCRERAYTAE